MTRYDVREAIEVEEFEDEGRSYYLLLDDGRTLFLSGQYLYAPAEQGFPWRSFEVVRIPNEHWVLTVTPLDEPLTPSHRRKPFTMAEIARDAVPLDGTVALVDWASLKAAPA